MKTNNLRCNGSYESPVEKQHIKEERPMRKRTPLFNRVVSFLICLALLISYLPMIAREVSAADKVTGSADIVADAGTAHTWETMMGTAADGNRYAGRLWADKSVYTNGQTALLNTSGAAGSTFEVNLEEDEAFQIIFSTLGSSMTTTTTNSYVGPMDVVLVLDSSGSMRSEDQGKTRLEWTIDAANELLKNLLEIPDVRIGLVSYNEDSEVILPLAQYTNGITLSVNSYTNSNGGGVITAKDNNGTVLGNDSGYQSGTNLQAGIDSGFRMLSNATDVTGRVPVAIVMTDGAANHAVRSNWYDVPNGTVADDNDAAVVLGTMLNAAFGKASVTNHYGKAPMVYSIGANLDSRLARALMDPAQHFNSANGNSNVQAAYSDYLDWANGETITMGNGNRRWTFDHGYSGVTRQQIIDNINYVDTYYDVDSSNLSITFTQIYEELSSGVFNPISSSQTTTGGTGVENTPLIFVDHIGQHMEIKRIQAVTLFGASFQVTHNADGSYTVAESTGVNPTTNEAYNTAEDIRISVTENADGTQTLCIEIDQEILPIILEQVVDNTVSGTSSATIAELTYNPLRVFYTVGLDSDIFLPTGEIDVSKIDDSYAYIDDATGQITFYSNRFGSVNKVNADGDPYVERYDSHIGFKPSNANRYYYHQSNVDIYTSVTATNGTPISWDASEYGVQDMPGAYNCVQMTYNDYLAMEDSNPTVYTKVTYYHPTADTTDAANAAEEVTYIVYTEWQYLKESVAFYDSNAGVYINYTANGYTTDSVGYAMGDQVDATIAAYRADNPNADIKVVLGVGSLRTSRLHNMTVAKTENVTGTSALRYAPEYTYETAADHSGNDVVVWLGNNGALTTTIATGIALTKSVTEAIGDPDDTYAVTVTIPEGVTATPVVKDENGQDVTAAISTYANRVLTVNLKAGQTVYISGIPVGTECVIGEVIQGDYYIESQTNTVTIPTLSQVLAGTAQYVPANVTNAPYKYGNLHITKEMNSDHAIPAGVLAQEFALKVHVGVELAGQSFTVKLGNLDNPSTETETTATVDAEGNLNLTIYARQTIDILDLPEGIQVVITEELTTEQQKIFAVSYRTRNHTGEDADNDNIVTIPAGASVTAVVTNQYTPQATTVDLDIAGTKHFVAEDNAILTGGSFTFLVQRWDGSAWVDMTSAQTVYAAGENGAKTFLIEDVLQGITYTQTGTWSYQVLEVKGTLENLTYDRTLYTFTVTVTDNDGALVATVTDVNNTEITDGSYEVSFTNTYHTAPVSIDVFKDVVNNSGDDTVSKAGFAFTAVQTDVQWTPLADGAILTVYSDAAGEARFTATYTQAGTYYYLVSEVHGAAPGWTYSNAQYRVTVTVTEDNGNLTSTMTVEAVADTTAGGEQASVTGNSGSISFVNTYDPADATLNLDGKVFKNLTGKTLTADQFTFYVCENGTVAAVRGGNLESVVLIGTNDLDGNVTFVDFAGELVFDKAGKYEFDIVEMIPEGAVYDDVTGKYFLNGMSYDATIYDLVVEVTNNSATGQLEAVFYFEDSTVDTVTFYNVYTVTPTTYTFQGTKLLTGRAMSAGEFTFVLYEGGVELERVTNKADGTFSFATITYTSAGTYTYTICEEGGSAPGVTYTGASNPITITVTVSDTNGILSAVADVANADIQFENTYTAEAAEVTFDGIKTLVGATLVDNTFSFKLYQTDSSFQLKEENLIQTVTNISGRYSFDTLEFDTTGTYFYAIVEDATVNPQAEVVYDGTVHMFRVQVSDVGDGQLKVEVQNLNTGITTLAAASVNVSTSFTNATFDEVTEKEVYLEGSQETHIDGQKVNAGDILVYHITYTNYTGEDVTVDIMDTIPQYTSYVEGSASHGGSYAGTHVLWVLNVARGESVTVTFQVKVDESNAVVHNTAVVRDGINTYSTNQVTNHTYDDVAQKDVFSADDTTASINGQQVALGDILHYTISFTNTTAKSVSVTITDAIPANTVYVENSATLNGVYADGVLTWNITDVPAWSTVTVSFQVKVTATEHVVIQNQANVAEGENHYTTKIVTNEHIPETTGFTVEKLWNDANNQDGKRPTAITVNIYGNDKLVTSVELTAANGWTHTLTGLDKYENGSEIVYTVEEVAVAGYTGVVTGSLAEGFTITNTHEVEKTSVTVNKQWDDNDNQDGKRPASIVVHLLANGEHTGLQVELNAANGWSYTWADLDVYHNGAAINYTVFEEAVEGYTADYLYTYPDDIHVTLINSYSPEQTGLTVQKVWVDNDNQDGLRPGSVEVELYANGAATGIKATLSAANDWCYSFTGLDRYANGVEIEYTAVELTVVEGYEVSYKVDELVGVYEVINTHVPAQIHVSVNKVWNDANDQDGIRPDSVEVELYADGVATGLTLTLSATNGWQGAFEGLDKFANGKEVVYTVQEVNVPAGYTVSYSGTTVTNTHVPGEVGITVNKVWDDAHNQDGIRPATITVNLYANGVKIDTQILDASMNWSYSWTGLDKFDAGVEIVYTVEEEAVEGYTATIDGFTITNTHVVEKTEMSVSKVWDDANNQDGKRPDSIIVHLLADGEHTGLKVELNAANGWEYTWTDLDKYSGGKLIDYTVYEEAVSGYTATYTRDTKDDSHIIITNTYSTEKTSLAVQKLWVDNHDQDGIRPDSIQVELYANDNPTGIIATLTVAGHWAYTFEGLDKYADGEEITYTVKEIPVSGYTSAISVDEMTGVVSITNTHVPETVSVAVNKVWADNNDQDGIRPGSIQVELYADGVATGLTLTLSAADGWQGEFEDLAKYSYGTEVIYTVREVNVPDGYAVSYDGTTITNTHVPGTVEITVNKVWNDANNQDGKRPATITVHLYANGVKIDTQVLDASMNWSYTWTGLAQFEAGSEIVYTVDEVAVAGYTTEIDGFTITNTHEVEKTTVTVDKLWDDNDNQDGKRPTSIIVHLLANGEHTGLKVELNAANGWSYTWTDLDVYHNGTEINYTVYEEAVAGYTADYQYDYTKDIHVTLTNSYSPEQTGLTVEKVWADGDNQDGLRPGSVEVELLANGERTGIKVTLSAINDWCHSFTGLDKYADGKVIEYTVEELTKVEGYEVSYKLDETTGLYEVINTHTPATIAVPVNKVWVDNNNQDGLRPGSIEVELYADGVATGFTLTLSAANNWQGVFGDMPKYAHGAEVVYTAREVNVPEGYTVSYNGTTVTNTHTPEIRDITVNKVWDDAHNQDGKRPTAITVYLYANGVKIDTQVLDASMNWSYTWTGLNKCENGSEIVYTVDEAAVEGYTTTVDGFTITNTHQVAKTEISVSKVWDDANNQDGKRPGSIIVHLLANGEHTGLKVELNAANGWEYTWTGLDQYSGGKEINYTVYEEAVAGYTTTYTWDSNDDNHAIITNSYAPEKTSLAVQKLWMDNNDQDGIRPDSIRVELLANGDPTGVIATLTAAGHWAYTFENLDQYSGGQKIEYTVREVAVSGYTCLVSVDSMTGMVTITNTHTPETVKVPVRKVWNDADNQDGLRPGSIEVELYADGIATGKTMTLSAANGWQGEFEGVAKYSNGTEVIYTVREVNVPEGYTVSYDGTTITNTHTPETVNITVDKVWNDANNQDGKRPTTITVHLYANGVKIDTRVLDASMNWSYTWTDLAKYEAGVAIDYTLDEVAVADYTTTIDGFTITNTHIPETVDVTVRKMWDDNNNQDGKRPESITVYLVANGNFIGPKVVLNESNGWTYTWEDMDKYHNGTEITYTVFEESVENYTAVYAWSPAHNLTIITNKYTPEKTNFTAQKVWMDHDNQDGLRPDSVEVELLANGQRTGIKVILNAENHWRYTFTDLDKYANGEEIRYTVEELTQIEGYEVDYKLDEMTGLFEVINIHDPEKVEVPVIKVWNDANDQDGLRPHSIEVELYADGVATGIRLTLSAANGWQGVFEGLNKYAFGIEMAYTVREVNVPAGYTVSYDGATVTNTHTPETVEITVNKVWNDNDNQDGKRPTTITVHLYANGELVATQALDAFGNWSYTWTELAKYEAGVEIVYTVDEVAVEGYTTTVDGFTITNTHIPETVEITVSKVWNDSENQDGKRPDSIIVHLLADGEHTGLKVELSEANGWEHTWTGLDQYSGGEEINYTIYEETVEGYTTTYTRDTNDDNHVIITNTYSVDKTSFTVLKVWHDDHDLDGLREEVVVELLANDDPTGITVTLSEANHWTHTFEDLDKYADGELIVYSAVELTQLEGYETTYKTDSYTGIFEIINTHVPNTTQVTVNKVWDDNNDQDGIRPESVQVHLLANGVETGLTAVLSMENKWTYTWTDLPVYSEGVLIVYTVEEIAVAGYTAQYTQDGTAITITNIHTPELVDVSVSKLWDDENNRDGIRPQQVEVALVVNGVVTDQVLVLNAENDWSGVWSDLPKYSNGKLIVYTVVEKDVAEGYVSVVEAENDYAFVVTNRHAPEKTGVTVLKLWQDNDNVNGTRPQQIVVTLLANGVIVDKVILDESNGWTYTWSDLYQYADGEEIRYTVEEISKDKNYTVTYSADEGENGEILWQITNTLIGGNPGTGDFFHTVALLMVLSMAGIVTLLVARKKDQAAEE